MEIFIAFMRFHCSTDFTLPSLKAEYGLWKCFSLLDKLKFKISVGAVDCKYSSGFVANSNQL